MTLTKRHFERTAEILRDMRGEIWATADVTASETVTSIERRLADWYASENPAFDRERFRSAANTPEPGTRIA